MKEFQVNDLIVLRMIEGKTVLFVNNKEFKQCKILLLNIPTKNQSIQEMGSIDEFSEYLDSEMEIEKIAITPEEEFMGHCSNLQAWVENGYDTTLLHRGLAFPLLHALSKEGDKMAENRFKEEIARRFKNGNKAVQIYLLEEEYIYYLTYDEMIGGILEVEDYFFLKRFVNYLPIPRFDFIKEEKREDRIFFSLENGRIRELELYIDKNSRSVPREIETLKSLERLHIHIKKRSDNIFPEHFCAESVKYLRISCRIMGMTIPDFLFYFPNLKQLRITGILSRPVVKLKNSFKKLTNLETLELEHVNIEKLPDTIINLQKLWFLTLQNTLIQNLSVETIESLKSLSLKSLNLYGNKKLEISQEIIKKWRKGNLLSFMN